MSKIESTTYHCDNCGRELNTYKNSLAIVTQLDDSNIGWRRLRVRIEHHHGSHNDGTKEDADLCQECAITLLTDALRRVKAGERATKGSE